MPTLKYFKNDFASGLVVFLVALPLCLGIALASGAPLFAGIISGIVGGIVIGMVSSSHVSVSGPAAGLAAIVLTSIASLGSFQLFTLAVVLAGVIQLVLGYIKAGAVSNYFPNNVVEGMLAGIGVIIFLKQLPHAVGYDVEEEGDLAFEDHSNNNTITTLLSSLEHVSYGAILISLVGLLILIFWDKIPVVKDLKLIPSALVAVVSGIVINQIFISTGSPLALSQSHLVSLPMITSLSELNNILVFPDYNGVTNSQVWVAAITIAVVASIETLLCIEAGDRLDPYKRFTHQNQELKAQGIGNVISGLLGGLPLTSVVVRTTANITAGNRTKLSAVIHGVLLLVSVLAIPTLLNMIPLSSLAAILLVIGYKLANPNKLKHFWAQGKYQFVPFIATLTAVVFSDLLKGVALGMVISFIFILVGNIKRAYNFRRETYKDGDTIHIDLAEEVSFLNKAAIKTTLQHLPENSKVIIDATNSQYIAYDVEELIKDFKNFGAKDKNIDFTLIGFDRQHDIDHQREEDNNVWIERGQSSGNQTQLLNQLTSKQ